jgi:hypothetical protein
MERAFSSRTCCDSDLAQGRPLFKPHIKLPVPEDNFGMGAK